MSRLFFFVACIAIGISAGWWVSYGSPPKPGTVNQYANNWRASVFSPSPGDNSASPGGDPTNTATVNSLIKEAANDKPVVLSYYDGIMKVAPSVVSLFAKSSNDDQSISQGSGVIVDANGVVLTNLHLINNLDLITVVLSDGRSYAAQLIGSDQETDLAVVRINARNLPFLRLDEADPLRVGDVVLAIGNPLGVGQTVTQGIVSATRRRIAGGTVWQNFVQIDAAINPGNSGGALINPYGQLVGVNTAVLRGDSGAIGIGFSIPADLLAQVVPQIIENGSVARGWLGIGVEDITMFPILGRLDVSGAVITALRPDSPATQGGLKPMDIVVRLGEQPIFSATQLLLQVSALPPGATVKLSVLRGAESDSLRDPNQVLEFTEIDLKMRLGTRPNMATAQ